MSAEETQPQAQEPETVAEATMVEPRSGPEAEERAYEGTALEEEAIEAPAAPEQTILEQAEEHAGVAAEQRAREVSADFDAGEAIQTPAVAADWDEPPQPEATDDEFSPFPAADELEPRRRSPIVAVLIAILVVVALAVAFYFLAPPEWKARLGVGTGAASQLALVTTHMDRQQLASGNQLLTITGRVINPTSSEQVVPPLQAQIRTQSGKVVYSWTIPAPARTLAPGASASFNSAEVKAPSGGDELTITLDQPKA